MRTRDIMTQGVMSIRPGNTIGEAILVMLEHHISGLPVIDDNGDLVGIVTEGDFMRRAELHTGKKRSRLVTFLLGPNAAAEEYIHTNSRKVADVMTPVVAVVTEDTGLREVVRIMEKTRVKRLPVIRGREVVGIVSRANLLHALAALQPTNPSDHSKTDAEIRTQILDEVRENIPGIGQYNVTVKDGVVDLWGTIFSDSKAIRIAAENVPGVKQVHDNLVWVEPYSGAVIEPVA